jgi:hypothetical protein
MLFRRISCFNVLNNIFFSARWISVQKATKHLVIHACRICTRAPDKIERVRYCQWFRQLAPNDVNILKSVFFTDEIRFHLSRCVNRQHRRMQSSHNPDVFLSLTIHTGNIGVFCAVTSRRHVLGPRFFRGSKLFRNS